MNDLFGGAPVPEVRKGCRFEEFWAAYPRKISKRTAENSYHKALKRGASESVMIAAAKVYSLWLVDPDAQWRPDAKHASTWLNGDCWNDDLPAAPQTLTWLDMAKGYMNGQR
jgi:hypothetical protein